MTSEATNCKVKFTIPGHHGQQGTSKIKISSFLASSYFESHLQHMTDNREPLDTKICM